MPDRTPHREIVVAVDGSPESNAAVRWATHDALLRGAVLVLVNVVPDRNDAPWLDSPSPEQFDRVHRARALEILDEARQLAFHTAAPHAVDVGTRIVAGDIVAHLIDTSKDAEMIVVGSRGHGRLEGALLGSVSAGLVHHARCAVAVIHGSETPAREDSTAPVVVGFDGSPASEVAMGVAFDEAARRGVDLMAAHAYSDASVMFEPSEWLNFRPLAVELLDEGVARWGKSYPNVNVRPVVISDRPAHELLQLAESAQLLVVGTRGRGALRVGLGSVSSSVARCARVPVIVARAW